MLGRLVQRLVWVDGTGARLFRPVEDGSLIGADDEAVTLDDTDEVGLAHGSMMDAEQARAWLAHFKDYKLTALFAQMTRSLPMPALLADGQCISDHQGWAGHTFALRSAFTALAYQRGAVEGRGYFLDYVKHFASVGICVRIEFAGSCVHEQNIPAAHKSLSFSRTGESSYPPKNLPLEQVPPVLLAEAYGDYHAVAAGCSGFDPEWEAIEPW